MSLKKSAGVDNTARRTWDKAEYEDKAQEREVQVSSLEQGRGPCVLQSGVLSTSAYGHADCRRRMPRRARWTLARGDG